MSEPNQTAEINQKGNGHTGRHKWRLALNLAWKETRRARGKFLVSLLAVIIGTGAFALIRSLVVTLESSISRQSRSIMGADLRLRKSTPWDEEAKAFIQQELPAGTRTSSEIQFYSMLRRLGEVKTSGEKSTPGTTFRQSQLVRVRTMPTGPEAAYPFYGDVKTIPKNKFSVWRANPRSPGNRPLVLLNEKLAGSLGVAPGSRVRLGKTSFEVAGLIVNQPGSPLTTLGYAPLALVAERDIGETGLVQKGSRVRYQMYVELPPGVVPVKIKESILKASGGEKYPSLGARTHEESLSGMQRFLDRLAMFLSAVGLTTLLLGGLGMGAVMRSFTLEKVHNSAILKTLGFKNRDVLLIYFLTALFLALGGGILGAGLGYLGGRMAMPLFAAYFPFAVTPGGFGLIFAQTLLGALAAVFLFSFQPVLRLSQVRPARVLRDEPGVSGRDWRNKLIGFFRQPATWLAYGFSALILFLLLGWSGLSRGGTWEFAGGYILAVLAAVVLLNLSGWLLARVLARLSDLVGNFALRQGIVGLFRPGNQTRLIYVSLGMGFFLVSGIDILQSSILKEIRIDQKGDRPNFFSVDLRREDLDGFRSLLKENQAEGLRLAPMIYMRLKTKNGEPIGGTGNSQEALNESWQDRVNRRGLFVSYREKQLKSETIVDGKWWTESGQAGGLPRIGLDTQFADGLDIEVGDRLGFDVGGLPLEGVVANLRQVRWQAMAPNTMVLFSPHPVLRSAPAMYVASFRLPEGKDKNLFQNQLVEAIPHIRVIDLSDAVTQLEGILASIHQVIQGVSWLALAVGLLILVNSLMATQSGRLVEATLYKVLGAGRKKLAGIYITEFAVLGFLGCLTGLVLALLLTGLAGSIFLSLPLAADWGKLTLLVVFLVGISVVAGLRISWEIFSVPPLRVLRRD